MMTIEKQGEQVICPDAFCGANCYPAPANGVVGKRFKGCDDKTYLCESYDSGVGYWMVDVWDSNNRRCVSERAIKGNFKMVEYG